MVDRVVLELLDQVEEVVRLRDERAVVADQRRDAAQLGEEVVHVREHVGAGHDRCRTVLGAHLLRDLLREERLHRRHVVLDRDLRDVGRLDAEHAHAFLLEALEQRPVVRADVDREVVGAEPEPFGDVVREAPEVLLEQARHRGAVRVLGEEDDLRRSRVVELREPAARAAAEDERKVRLRLAQHLLGEERVARRVVAEVEDGLERARSATLAARDPPEDDLVRALDARAHDEEPSLRATSSIKPLCL